MSKQTKPLSIFRPGRHVTNRGDTLTFTEADVAATAAAYDQAKHRAPLVIGHPKTDTPAYGWTSALEFADGLLKALPNAVTAEFADWVNQGFYNTISAAFYPPNSPNNPVPGVYYVRHIGFLGGHPPAVKGLPAPEFADDADMVSFAFAADDTDFITLEFAEENPSMPTPQELEQEKARLAAEAAELEKQKKSLSEREAEFAERDKKLLADAAALAAEKAARTKTEIAEFAEAQIKAGKLLPKDKAGAVEFMAGLAGSVEIEFGEGDSKTKQAPLSWFQSFLQSLPKQIEFGEQYADTGSADPAKTPTAEEVAVANQLGLNPTDIVNQRR